ncbi:MAG: hypothetical protein QNK20_01755 [Aureibaculum sp.]|nr:hypothetical protein [Aureibaculum sp.]
MSKFYVDSEQLLNYTLKLQKINDVALPIALQNTLNSVAADVKKRTLKISTEEQFKIKKKTFFNANSGYVGHKAKDFNYNINKLKAEVGIIKGKKAKEKATEQVGNQQTATSIKRSINPLGNKPKTKAIIDILSKKPEVYQNETSGFNPGSYYRKLARANKNKTPFLYKNSSGTRGSVGIVKSFRRLKSGKKKGRIAANIQPIASYKKGGTVKLRKKRPFLDNAVKKSVKEMMESNFIKEAEKQVQRVLKR